MRLKHSRQAPNSLNDYERTFNHAIDMVAEAVAWGKKVSMRPLRAIVLKPTQYELFKKGFEFMMQRDIDINEQLTFEGIFVLKGSPAQFDSIRLEFVDGIVKIPHGSN
jgi:hypothetical protein